MKRTYYKRLHLTLKRKMDSLSPRAHRRLLIALLLLYGTLSCYFIAQFFIRRDKDESLEQIIEQKMQLDSLIARPYSLSTQPTKEHDNGK